MALAAGGALLCKVFDGKKGIPVVIFLPRANVWLNRTFTGGIAVERSPNILQEEGEGER